MGDWKAFIFHNFLINGNQVYPSIGDTLQTTNDNEYETKVMMIDKITTTSTLQSVFTQLPLNLQDILQTVHFPADNGQALFESLMRNDLTGASDRSIIIDNTGRHGGFSFSLQDYHNNNDRMVGFASLPQSNDATSLTAELYGILGTVLLFTILWKTHEDKFPASRARVIKLVSDNKEDIDKCNEDKQRMNVSQHLKPEYNLEK